MVINEQPEPCGGGGSVAPYAGGYTDPYTCYDHTHTHIHTHGNTCNQSRPNKPRGLPMLVTHTQRRSQQVQNWFMRAARCRVTLGFSSPGMGQKSVLYRDRGYTPHREPRASPSLGLNLQPQQTQYGWAQMSQMGQVLDSISSIGVHILTVGTHQAGILRTPPLRGVGSKFCGFLFSIISQGRSSLLVLPSLVTSKRAKGSLESRSVFSRI